MALIEFTRRGYIEVFDADGNKVSQHTLEREAIERVSNLILEQPAGKESKFEIRGPLIVAKGYGVLSPGGGDTTAPTTPGSLTGLATSATTITLSWTQSTDNIGVAGYQIFRNGSPIATTSSLSYNDSGLTPSTQYSYTVTAYDAAGNNSSAAGPALVTTNSNSAPVWSLGNQSYDNGDAVNISLDGVCSDADGDPITYSLVSGSLPTGLALSGARNQTLSGTVTADGTYAFTLGASDGIAAVQNVALTFTVTTPDTTAPDAPSAPIVLSSTSSTITLSLPTSGAGDHASYTIQRSTDGTNYGNRATGITASTWQDTGLSASTTYYYRLIDVDVSGNASTPGASVSRQTSAPTAGTNAARIDAILAGRSPHFSYSTPADPVTTREETVTTATAFNNAALTAGTRIIVNQSFSGAVSINRDDIDVVMSNGATITGSLTIGSSQYVNRVRWTGGNILGVLTTNRVNDLLFDDVYINCGRSFNYIGINNPFSRYAFINSTLMNEGWGGVSADNWTFFVLSGVDHNNLILANVKILGDGLHVTRIMQTRNIVVCDTVFNPAGTAGGSGLRLHTNCQNVWIKDSWCRQNFHLNNVSGSDSTPQVANALFDNFDRYESMGTYAFTAPLNVSNSGEVRNSRLSSTAGAGGGTFSIGGGMTTGSGCDRVAWDGTTVPDYSTVGAIR